MYDFYHIKKSINNLCSSFCAPTSYSHRNKYTFFFVTCSSYEVRVKEDDGKERKIEKNDEETTQEKREERV